MWQTIRTCLGNSCAAKCSEMACSAILAAWGGGLYETPEAAVAAMSRAPGMTYYPDPKADYEAKYRRYVEMANRLARK